MPDSDVVINAGALVFPNHGLLAEDLYKHMERSFSQNTIANPIGFNPNTLQAQASGNKYPGWPNSQTAVMSGTGMLDPGVTPFQNKFFTQHFKVLKTRKFSMGPGARRKITLPMRPRMLSFATTGWTVTASAYVNPFALLDHSRFWLISFHGCPAPFLTKTDGTGLLKAIDTPRSVLGYYHVEDWCIRQAVPDSYNVNQRVSVPPTLTSTTAVSFGRDTRVGETVNAGTGGVVSVVGGAMSNICTGS